MRLPVSDVGELQEAVASCRPDRRLLPISGATKPPLCSSEREDVDLLDVSALTGLIEYDPAEMTFTASAATPIAEVEAALSQHNQYLPFDPPLAQSGATLAGAVSAGASGSNALRHGGIRDFVIGVRFVDGTGRLLTGGGKVVKNAAGFDLSKLMVGSLGRLGVMTQLSFKVFPRPRATATLEFAVGDTARALATACKFASGPREIDALDVLPGGRLLVRLGGDPEALSLRLCRVASDGVPGTSVATYSDQEEQDLWTDAAELKWAAEGVCAVKVPITAGQAVPLERSVLAANGSVRFSLGANVAWVAWPSVVPLSQLSVALSDLSLSGVVLSGDGLQPLVGVSVGNTFGERVRAALDPHQHFLEV